jgi:acyl-ACP thioesterase
MAGSLTPLPARGRTYTVRRKVRLGDTNASGRLRLDALARYLQDVANDDALDAGLEGAMAWVVRRVEVVIARWPELADVVELTTWCSGVGSRWAERRTQLCVNGDTAVDAAALWVNLDPFSGRPAALGDQFDEIYGEAAAGRKVNSRLTHPAPDEAASRRPWVQRATDFDVLGHANNAIAFAAVEDALADITPGRVEVEYRDAIEPGDTVELHSAPGSMWLSVDGSVRVSARFVDGNHAG